MNVRGYNWEHLNVPEDHIGLLCFGNFFCWIHGDERSQFLFTDEISICLVGDQPRYLFICIAMSEEGFLPPFFFEKDSPNLTAEEHEHVLQQIENSPELDALDVYYIVSDGAAWHSRSKAVYFLLNKLLGGLISKYGGGLPWPAGVCLNPLNLVFFPLLKRVIGRNPTQEQAEAIVRDQIRRFTRFARN